MERAIRSAKPAWRLSQPSELFPDEHSAVCYPMDGLGLLYVGREKAGRFDPSKTFLLELLARQGGLALASTQRLLKLDEAYRQAAQSRDQLQAWSQGLERLLEAIGRVSLAGSRAELEQSLELSLKALVPVSGGLWAEPEWLRSWGGRLSPKVLEGPAQRAVEAGRPMLLDRLGEKEGCLLIAPILSQRADPMVVVLWDPQSETLGRLEHDLVHAFCLQAAISLENCLLYQEVTDSYRQLRDSKTQLFQSSKPAAVGQFAAGLAHELNTPLASVMLALDEASMVVADESLQEQIELAVRELTRAQGLVEKLLYYSRESTGKRTRVEVETVRADVVKLLAARLRQSQLGTQGTLRGPPW